MNNKDHSSLSGTQDKSVTTLFHSAEACVDAAIQRLGKKIVLGLPLGLGKANHIANAFFARAQADSSLSLHIITALTLELPQPTDELSRRFLKPIQKELYQGYTELLYAQALRQKTMPANIQVLEFFFRPGAYLSNKTSQQNHLSSNYTHVVRDLLKRGVNVVAQIIAPHQSKPDRFSLSSNTDITLDLLQTMDDSHRRKFLMIGQVDQQLPFMPNDAEVGIDYFDCILDTREASKDSDRDIANFTLFPVPLMPVNFTDYAIALHATSLVKDGGTLQIGFGALGDAITHALCLRQQNNDQYRMLLKDLIPESMPIFRSTMPVEQNIFQKGLYAASEMLVEGFLHLRRAGILKRRVYANEVVQSLLNDGLITDVVTPDTLRFLLDHHYIQDPLTKSDVNFLKQTGILDSTIHWKGGNLYLQSGEHYSATLSHPDVFDAVCQHALGTHLLGGVYLHAGFYLGSSIFYQALRDLNDTDRSGINMIGISYINELYGQEKLKKLQRGDARFINSAMMVTLTGAVISDGLDNASVVSGVGGQYNFVAQAHELDDARSIICLPSTRLSHGRLRSNILWQYTHTTIPRHLRDVVVTEYGAVDLRGKSDHDVIVAMLSITDSRFQTALLKKAKQAGKIEKNYQMPTAYRNNHAQRVREILTQAERLKLFPHYPLGTSFSPVDASMAIALQYLKARKGSYIKLAALCLHGYQQQIINKKKYKPYLQRMNLERAKSLKEYGYRLIIIGAVSLALQPERPITDKDKR